MLLSIKNISKTYKNPKGNIARQVISNLDFEVNKGEKTAIVGPSGSGKTTLLNLIGSLDIPDSGEILFEGKNIVAYTNKEKEHYRNKKIGFVFQLHHLLPQCTLLENVLIPTLPFKNNNHGADDLLKTLGIWDVRNQKPGELSGGECQRAAIARAMINKPSIILADEPTGALDEKNANNLMDLLADINKRSGTTIILVTHSPEYAGRMDKIYHLHNGQLEFKS